MNGYKRGIKHVFNTTLNDAGFEDEIIDSVGLFDVIEHIKDDYLFMCDINKYMKIQMIGDIGMHQTINLHQQVMF